MSPVAAIAANQADDDRRRVQFISDSVKAWDRQLQRNIIGARSAMAVPLEAGRMVP